MKYSFTLKDNNLKAYYLFTWFLFFLHVVAAALFALNTNDGRVKLDLYISLGFYAVISIAYYFFKNRNKALETFSFILALLYGNFWLKQVGFLAVIIFAIVYLLVTAVKGKSTTVVFTDTGIQLTRVFKTIVFPWKEMQNVILKDNILTIDFKTNKIIQVEIIETAKAVDEYEFNLFCTAQLGQSAIN